MINAAADSPAIVAVIDFRRRAMVLKWNVPGGTWSPFDEAPALVHGIALIRAVEPNICLYGDAGQLHLQIGRDHYPLSDTLPRIHCSRRALTFGLRRHFRIDAPEAGVIFSHSYWNWQSEYFFDWLAAKARDPAWRRDSAVKWTEGVGPADLRAAAAL